MNLHRRLQRKEKQTETAREETPLAEDSPGNSRSSAEDTTKPFEAAGMNPIEKISSFSFSCPHCLRELKTVLAQGEGENDLTEIDISQG